MIAVSSVFARAANGSAQMADLFRWERTLATLTGRRTVNIGLAGIRRKCPLYPAAGKSQRLPWASSPSVMSVYIVRMWSARNWRRCVWWHPFLLKARH